MKTRIVVVVVLQLTFACGHLASPTNTTARKSLKKRYRRLTETNSRCYELTDTLLGLDGFNSPCSGHQAAFLGLIYASGGPSNEIPSFLPCKASFAISLP